jgi:hypothetical protein
MPTVSAASSRHEIRRQLGLWNVGPEDYEIIWEFNPRFPGLKIATGVRLRFLRQNAWQEISCFHFGNKDRNLGQIRLLLERLRVAEKQGVVYRGLTSSKAVIVSSAPEVGNGRLGDDYDIMGADPGDSTDMLRHLYKVKSRYYHPDGMTPDAEKFKALTDASERIMKSRGEHP